MVLISGDGRLRRELDEIVRLDCDDEAEVLRDELDDVVGELDANVGNMGDRLRTSSTCSCAASTHLHHPLYRY